MEKTEKTPERQRLEEQLQNLSCTTYFDGLVFCTTPTNQFKSLYRFGQLDDCAEAVSGLKACMSIKMNKISNKEKALEQLKVTGIKKSKTYGIIWQPRDKAFINFPQDNNAKEKDENNKMQQM
jgi:hypothetical protein